MNLAYLLSSLAHALQALLRSQLSIDNDGMVLYNQFVQVAKQMFKTDLLHLDMKPSNSAIPSMTGLASPPQKDQYSSVSIRNAATHTFPKFRRSLSYNTFVYFCTNLLWWLVDITPA